MLACALSVKQGWHQRWRRSLQLRMTKRILAQEQGSESAARQALGPSTLQGYPDQTQV